MVNISIKSSYFRLISTDFHKQRNLFWEQRVGGLSTIAKAGPFTLRKCPCQDFSPDALRASGLYPFLPALPRFDLVWLMRFAPSSAPCNESPAAPEIAIMEAPLISSDWRIFIRDI